jgi:hypothetical protein
VVTNAVYFFAYKYWQKVFLKFNVGFKPGNVYFSIISSLFAAITCALVTNPIWVLHTRMANSIDHKVYYKYFICNYLFLSELFLKNLS